MLRKEGSGGFVGFLQKTSSKQLAKPQRGAALGDTKGQRTFLNSDKRVEDLGEIGAHVLIAGGNRGAYMNEILAPLP